MVQFSHIEDFYGFDLSGASKLILTQGFLDPWSVGGATIDKKVALQNNIFMYTIDGAAHHLDLRIPNSCDPSSKFI